MISRCKRGTRSLRGETLGYIGQLYGVSAEEIAAASSLAANLDSCKSGPIVDYPHSKRHHCRCLITRSFPIVSWFTVPAARDFDVRAFVQPFNSYLLRYQETVEGQPLNGTDIVQLAADRLMVNPRLLLAALEYQSGW